MNKIYCFGDNFITFQPRDPQAPLRDAGSFRRHLSGGGAGVSHCVASLGGNAAYIGAVSRDPFGDYIRRTLRTAGVDLTRMVRVESADTPLLFESAGSRPREEKQYCCAPPHRAIAPELVEDFTPHGSDIILLEAGFLCHDNARAAADAMLAKAREAGCLLCIDACLLSPGEEAQVSEFLPRYLQDALLIATDDSLSRIAGEAADTAALAALLLDGVTGPAYHRLGRKLTDGSFRQRNGWQRGKNAYLGGFLFRLSKEVGEGGYPSLLQQENLIADTMRFAGAVSALAVTKRGALLGYTAFDEVMKMISKQTANTVDSLEEMKRLVQKDYHRLRYHVMPECGWMNDPNGLVEYNGEYHAFFQHYPNAPEWGPMHWGHVVSSDLLHWRHLPCALTPDQPYEKGCFSGSAVDNGGELTLIYTAHDDDATPKEKQCIATSSDGVTFEKYGGNPLVLPPQGLGDDFRDPKVSFVAGRWHMVVGSTRQGKGCVSMFASDDLRSWEYKGVICESNGSQGDMWECPDLFQVDGVDVLMFSPMNIKGCKTLFVTGRMDYDTYTFTQESYYEVDFGYEFYAPQTLLDSKGRRILMGWMEMWGNDIPTQKNGWAGALTLPRELYIRDGHVCQRPVEEVESLRQATLFQGSLTLEQGRSGNLPEIHGDCMEIALTLNAAAEGILHLKLRASGDGGEKTLVSYNCATQELCVDKTHSGLGKRHVSTATVAPREERLELRLFLDTSSLEVFADGGRCVISSRIYPDPASLFCDISAEGRDLTLSNLEIYSFDQYQKL